MGSLAVTIGELGIMLGASANIGLRGLGVEAALSRPVGFAIGFETLRLLPRCSLLDLDDPLRERGVGN